MTRAERRYRREKVLKKRESFIKNCSDWKEYIIGRYNKRKPFDCGNPGCGCCHSQPHDIHSMKKKTLSWNEQLNELEKNNAQRIR